MKTNLLLIAAIGTTFLFSSCTKDFVCECTNTNTLTSNAYISESTVKEVTKKQAKAYCISSERTFTSSGITYVETDDCELK